MILRACAFSDNSAVLPHQGWSGSEATMKLCSSEAITVQWLNKRNAKVHLRLMEDAKMPTVFAFGAIIFAKAIGSPLLLPILACFVALFVYICAIILSACTLSESSAVVRHQRWCDSEDAMKLCIFKQ